MGYDFHARLNVGGGATLPIDLTTDVTGVLPEGNLPPSALRRSLLRRYTHDAGVPGGSGIRFLRTGQGVPCSSAGDRLVDAERLVGISIKVDVIDASRDYDIEVISAPSGVPVVLATLALASGLIGAQRRDLAVNVIATTEVGVRLVRTAGVAGSTFAEITVDTEWTIADPDGD